MNRKDFSSMNDYDEARKTSYREVRSHWIDIVENYNQAVTLLYESPKDSLGKCFVLLSIGTHLMKL